MDKDKIIERLLEILEIEKELGLIGQQLQSAGEAFGRLRGQVEGIKKELREMKAKVE